MLREPRATTLVSKYFQSAAQECSVIESDDKTRRRAKAGAIPLTRVPTHSGKDTTISEWHTDAKCSKGGEKK